MLTIIRFQFDMPLLMMTDSFCRVFRSYSDGRILCRSNKFLNVSFGGVVFTDASERVKLVMYTFSVNLLSGVPTSLASFLAKGTESTDTKMPDFPISLLERSENISTNLERAQMDGSPRQITIMPPIVGFLRQTQWTICFWPQFDYIPRAENSIHKRVQNLPWTRACLPQTRRCSAVQGNWSAASYHAWPVSRANTWLCEHVVNEFVSGLA